MPPKKVKQPIKRKPIKKELPKPSGELALFQSIWASRTHTCTVCRTKLGEFSVWFFSHVLSKGAFPKFRLYEKNIVLKCKDCHHKYETQPIEKLVEENDRWIDIALLHDELITEYYGKD